MLHRLMFFQTTPGIARVRPIDTDVPLAAFVVGVERHVDAISVMEVFIEFVLGPVVVAGRVEPEKLDAVAGAVDDGHVPIVGL